MSTPIAEQLHALAAKSDPETARVLIKGQVAITVLLAALNAAVDVIDALEKQAQKMQATINDEDGAIDSALRDARDLVPIIGDAIMLAAGVVKDSTLE